MSDIVNDVVLASKSSIRAALLRGAGLRVEIIPADIDERLIEDQWRQQTDDPALIAKSLAGEKALAVSRISKGRIVIGADQTMALGTQRFSKVSTTQEARSKLQQLRGRTHALHSAYAIAKDGTILADGVASARLAMRDFSDDFLDRYLEKAGEAIFSSVGCYQLEGLGVTLFEAIEGDYFTILGLPLLSVLASLRHHGLIAA